MEFLNGSETRKKIVTLLSEAKKIKIAVAYWGDGAAAEFALNEHRENCDLEIVCDLMSGSCNPYEIKKINSYGFNVSKLERLHAKVWWTDKGAIVGPQMPPRTA